MKKNKFSESKILSILKEVEGGQKVSDVARKNGVTVVV